jgi:hypothetical protein
MTRPAEELVRQARDAARVLIDQAMLAERSEAAA